ncbi:MAG: hypothetical protein ACKVQQ_13210 [Burkholderiales bacterium]
MRALPRFVLAALAAADLTTPASAKDKLTFRTACYALAERCGFYQALLRGVKANFCLFADDSYPPYSTLIVTTRFVSDP